MEATASGIDWVEDHAGEIDLAFEATSARVHAANAPRLAAAGHHRRRPDPGPAGPAGRAGRQPDRAPGRAEPEPDHLRRPGHGADRGRGGLGQPGAVRRDRLHRRLPLGRAGHPPEHRRVHPDHRPLPGGGRRRRPRQGDHHPQPRRPADPDAQHRVLRPARRLRRGGGRRRDRGHGRPGRPVRARLPAQAPAGVRGGAVRDPGRAGRRPGGGPARGRGRRRLPARLRRQPRHHDRGRRPGRRGHRRGPRPTGRCRYEHRLPADRLDPARRLPRPVATATPPSRWPRSCAAWTPPGCR